MAASTFKTKMVTAFGRVTPLYGALLAMEGCQECSQCRPPAPKYRAVAPVREVVQQLHGLLEVHDDEFENLDLMELYCELAKVRQALDAAQVDLTKEVVEEGRILKAFAQQSGIAYGTVQRWARQ